MKQAVSVRLENGTAAEGGSTGLFRWMPPYGVVNPVATACSFALPATLGSGVSFWYHGALGWGIFELLSRRRAFSRDRPMWILFGFLALFAAANLAGFWLNGVPGARPSKLAQLVTFLGLPVVYSILAYSRKADIAFAAVAGSALASLVAAGVAFVQFYGWHIRAEGLAGNALVFAHVVTLSGSLCLLGLLLGIGERHGLRLQALLACGFAAATVALVLSASRTYWLVFLVVSACTWLCFRRAAFQIDKRTLLAGFVAAMAIGVFAYGPVTARFAALEQDWQGISDDGDYDNSLGLRLKLWQVAAQLISHHPWIGYGLPSNKPLIEAGLASVGIDMSFSHFHNGFVTATVDAGVLGLLALLGAFGTLVAIAIAAIRDGLDTTQKFGGGMLLILTLTSAIGGSFNILFGHDILNPTFVLWAMTGLFLASGTSAPAETEREMHRAGRG